jgi:hypothetical protein
MKSSQFLKEGFVEDANEVHEDHEVHMARSDLFHAAEDALSLHKLLKNVSEQQGLEGWVAAKITLAADYLNTVREYVEYQLMSGAVPVASAMQTNELPIAEGVAQGTDEKDPNKKQPKKSGLDLSTLRAAAKTATPASELPKKQDKDQGMAEEQVTEMSAGSVATVVNPTPKNKAKVGTLFGGTYKQKKTK